jgi:hypothetical protein
MAFALQHNRRMGTRCKLLLFVAFIIASIACHSESPTQNPGNGQYFTVQVGSEQFVMFVTDASTVELAIENFQGKNHRFPSGKIEAGDGGFNQPYSWHFVPDTVRMVEAAIEVCDGTPQYVDQHVPDFVSVGYCPWSAKVVKIGR